MLRFGRCRFERSPVIRVNQGVVGCGRSLYWMSKQCCWLKRSDMKNKDKLMQREAFVDLLHSHPGMKSWKYGMAFLTCDE